MTRRRLLGAAAAAGAASVAGCTGSFIRIDRAETTIERRFGDVSRVRITEATDDVSVERFDGDAVQVRVHKRARGQTALSDLAFSADTDGDTLRVRTQKPNVVGVGGGSVDLEVAVPGSVTVDRVATADGDIALRGTGGGTTVESGDGDVTATGVRGAVTATTDDGDVAVERATGAVTARTADGDIAIRAPGAIREVRAGDGDVVATVPAVAGTATVRSDDGDVTVSLGDALDATVEVTTGDGDITAVGALDEVATSSARRLTGRVGDGSNELLVHADDGSVTLTTL